MAHTSFNFTCRYILLIIVLSILSSATFLYWSQYYVYYKAPSEDQNGPIDLPLYSSAWNHLQFPIKSTPPKHRLKIAVFVKKWPRKSQAGGLERHALTLHLALAEKGHELHVFTTFSMNSTFPKYSFSNLHFHLSKPTGGGYLDQASVWKEFQEVNSSGVPFDVVHTESVGLMHTRARYLTNIAVSWHGIARNIFGLFKEFFATGIAYETIHTDIIQELARDPQEPQSNTLTERLKKVVEEVKFFPRYAHHVATSDHAGDILKRIYMIPEERVHIIFNGVNEQVFKPDSETNLRNFKIKFGINSKSKSLVLGMAGRLVKDKGHPLMFEALKQLISENSEFRESVIVLVAGDGPWGSRYKELGENLVVLGPLDQSQLSSFYNAIDIFVNPTLRAQGLDHTLLEAMLIGKPVMATKLASITGSVIVGPEVGYTFAPMVDSFKSALFQVWKDGREILGKKGEVCRERGLKLFTATKMAAAYERLFLCISCKSGKTCKDDYCRYPTQLN